MSTVVIAGGQASATFATIDFSTPASPVVTKTSPGWLGDCAVAIDNANGAVGNFLGGEVSLFDISSPAAPVAKFTAFNTGLAGIGAIAISGTRIVVGEQNGNRVKLLDFSMPGPPQVVGTGINIMSVINSIAFLSNTIVVVAGPNDFRFAKVDFTVNPNNPIVSYVNPGWATGVTVDVDPASNIIVVGEAGGGGLGRVARYNAATLALVSTVTTHIASIDSIAVSGLVTMGGSNNDFNATRVDLSTTTNNNFNPSLGGGSTVAISGTLAALGAVVGPTVKLFDVSATPSALGNAATVGFAVQTIGITILNPVAALSTTTLSFGVVKVGTSKVLTVTVTNTGTLGLNLTAIQTSNPRFTVSPASASVPPGGSVTVTVAFLPTAAGALNPNLTMNTNDPSHPTLTVMLSGTGGQPKIAVTPTSLTLTAIASCQAGTGSVQIKNTGNVDLTVSSIGASGPSFAVAPISGTVTPGSTLMANVTFTSGTAGTVGGTLSIASDDPSSPNTTVSLTGTANPQPPPAISVTPLTLNFGAVQLQYFVGLRVSIANGSPCQDLIGTASVGGARFFVTADPNPVTLPATTTVPFTVGHAGLTGSVVVVVAPTAAGSMSGTLTITSNDPSQPSLTIPLSATGVQAAPITFEMVLDRSGSMAAAAPGGTKMDALKGAVRTLADLLIPGQGDQMGDIWFDSAFAVLTTLQPFDAAQQAAIDADVNTLTPRFNTSIGGGMQLAQAQFPATVTGRKVMLVFTDGLENTPPTIAAVQPQVAGDEVYAVGLGQPQNISAAALSQLATSANGKFFITDDTLVLRKQFVEVLADAFRQNMAADPIFTLNAGVPAKVSVPITDCETRITFVLNWENVGSKIDMAVVAPDGTRYDPFSPATNQLVRYGRGPAFLYYEIAIPPIDPGSGDAIGPFRVGQWTMEITPSGLLGPTERCAPNVIVESHLDFTAGLQVRDVYHPFTVQTTIIHDNVPGPNANVALTMAAPTKSLAQVLTPAVINRARNADQHPIPAGQRPLIPMKVTKYTLKTSGEGTHVVELPAPGIDGIYSFTMTAVGAACGGTFTRYSSFSAYIGREADGRKTQVKVARLGPAAALVTVAPRDVQGIALGPGLATTMTATLDGKTRVGVNDELDGSYSMRVAWLQPKRPPILTVTIGKTKITAKFGSATTGISRRGRRAGAQRNVRRSRHNE